MKKKGFPTLSVSVSTSMRTTPRDVAPCFQIQRKKPLSASVATRPLCFILATLLFASSCATRYQSPYFEEQLASLNEQDRKRCEDFALAEAKSAAIEHKHPPRKLESPDDSEITVGDVAAGVLLAPIVAIWLLRYGPAMMLEERIGANRQGAYNWAMQLCVSPLTLSRQLGPEHPVVADRLDQLALYHVSRGRLTEAEEFHMQAQAIRVSALEPGHPDIDNSSLQFSEGIRKLADDRVKQKQYGEAEELYKEALARQEQVVGPEDSRLVDTLLATANGYIAQGRNEEALPLYQRVLAIWANSGIKKPLDFVRLNAIEQFAVALRNTGQEGEARQILAGVESLEERYDPAGINRRLRCQQEWKRRCGGDALDFPSIATDLRPAQSYACYTVAMREGMTELMAAKNEIAGKLTEDQISNATKLADLWNFEDCEL